MRAPRNTSATPILTRATSNRDNLGAQSHVAVSFEGEGTDEKGIVEAMDSGYEVSQTRE